MKKFISILLAAVLMLATTTTAFAFDYSNDEISDELESEIIQSMLEQCYSGDDIDPEDVSIWLVKYAEDGNIYFQSSISSDLDVMVERIVGDYYYEYNRGNFVFRYDVKEKTCCELEDAFNKGIIDNNDLAEVAAMRIFGVRPIIAESGLDSHIDRDLRSRIFYLNYNLASGDEPYSDKNLDIRYDIKINYYGTTSDGSMYVSYTLPDREPSDEVVTYDFGNYEYTAKADEQVYYYGKYCAYNIYDLFTMKQAFDDGLIDENDLAEISMLHFGVTPKNSTPGDLNRDGKVDVNDVTTIQKYLADMEEFDNVKIFDADVNCDGRVSILDVTAMQKQIAE